MLTVRKGYPARVYIDWNNIDKLELDKLNRRILFCNEFGKLTSRTISQNSTALHTNEIINEWNGEHF